LVFELFFVQGNRTGTRSPAIRSFENGGGSSRQDVGESEFPGPERPSHDGEALRAIPLVAPRYRLQYRAQWPRRSYPARARRQWIERLAERPHTQPNPLPRTESHAAHSMRGQGANNSSALPSALVSGPHARSPARPSPLRITVL